MKIYSIHYDARLKASLDVDCEEKLYFEFANQFFRKEAESYLSKWQPPNCYHLNQNPKIATFTGCFSFLSYAFYDTLLEDKEMMHIFQSYGEVLPISCSDSDRIVYQYHCMNCLGKSADLVVHQEKETWMALSDPNKMSFRQSEIPDRGLFWLRPGTTALYTVENEELGMEHNFKMLYDARGYTGLAFTEIKLI
jgi:hypothetical protein